MLLPDARIPSPLRLCIHEHMLPEAAAEAAAAAATSTTPPSPTRVGAASTAAAEGVAAAATHDSGGGNKKMDHVAAALRNASALLLASIKAVTASLGPVVAGEVGARKVILIWLPSLGVVSWDSEERAWVWP